MEAHSSDMVLPRGTASPRGRGTAPRQNFHCLSLGLGDFHSICIVVNIESAKILSCICYCSTFTIAESVL